MTTGKEGLTDTRAGAGAYFRQYKCDPMTMGALDADTAALVSSGDPTSGSTLLHAAARIGNMEALFFLVRVAKWDVNVCDVFGGTPLHEALFYGETQAAAWLLTHGADPTLCDAGSNTAFHVGVLAQRRSCVLRLLRNQSIRSSMGPALATALGGSTSIEGRTVVGLAEDMGQTRVADAIRNFLLDPTTQRKDSLFGSLIKRSMNVIGVVLLAAYLASLHLPFLWAIVGVLSVGAAIVVVFNVMGTMKTSEAPYFFVTLNNAGFLCTWMILWKAHSEGVLSSWEALIPALATVCVATAYALACFSDPGTLTPLAPSVSDESAVDAYVAAKHDDPQGIMGFCTTCRVPRPNRSKHCGDCDSCFEVFDHHCVWIGACVGAGNHRSFMASLLAYELAALVVLPADLTYLLSAWDGGFWSLLPSMLAVSPFAFGILVCHTYGIFFVAYLLLPQSVFAARNVTYNESINGHRYHYLKSPESLARINPFDHGSLANLWDFAFGADRTLTTTTAPSWVLSLQSLAPSALGPST